MHRALGTLRAQKTRRGPLRRRPMAPLSAGA
jgi:hypothetical protein